MLYRAQIMLLDEPTNHLDVKNVAWLVNYLTGLTEVTSVIVSHDSTFLDNVCQSIVHYENRKLRIYKVSFFSQWHLLPQQVQLTDSSSAAFGVPLAGSYNARGNWAVRNASTVEGCGAELAITVLQGNLSEFVKKKPEARSYYELKSAQGLKFILPEPGFLEGIKTKDRPILKMMKVAYKRVSAHPAPPLGVTVHPFILQPIVCPSLAT